MKYINILLAALFGIAIGTNAKAQCPAGEANVTINVTTDAWGYEGYWEVVPTGNACGTGTIAWGGNAVVGCTGEGAQLATVGDPNVYGNSTTVVDAPVGCIATGTVLDLIMVDDFGDGATKYDLKVGGIPVGTHTDAPGGTTDLFTFTVVLPGNNLTADTTFYKGSNNASRASYYTQIPRRHAQLDTLFFGMDILNQGANDQTGVALNVNISGAGTFNKTSATQAIQVGKFGYANLATNDFFIANDTGVYNVAFQAVSDSIDEIPTNNTINETFNVTDTVYAFDDGVVTGGASFGLDKLITYGNAYEIRKQDTATSISVFFPSFGNTAFNADGNTVSFKLFNFSTNPPTEIAQHDFYVVQQADLGGWLTLKLANETPLAPGVYLAALQTLEDTTLFATGPTDLVIGNTFVDVDNNGQWSNTSGPAFVRLNTKKFNDPCDVLVVTTATTDATCNGDSDGSIAITATGGATPYTYTWNGTTGMPTATGLAPGFYDYEVTAADGCKKTNTVEVKEPGMLKPNATVVDNNCSAAMWTGSVPTAATGGTAPYTYLWGSGGTAVNAMGLTAGTYGVTVTDSKGCTGMETVTVSNTGMIGTTVTATTAPACGASDGAATVAEMGNGTAFTYMWSNGSTAATSTGLSFGVAWVTVMDANGCKGMNSIAMQNAGAPTVAVAGTNAMCNATSTGLATATVTGGTTPYAYTWTGSTMTGMTVSGLAAGMYNVTVSDASNCNALGQVTITEPTALTVTTASTNVNCNGGTDGTATATAAGGTVPYAYAWTGGGSAATYTTGAGTITVTVTDNNGCTMMWAATITEPSAVTATATSTNPVCNGATTGTATVAGNGGSTPYTYSWSNGMTSGQLTAVGAGTYTGTVTDANGCSMATTAVIITDPAAISITGVVTDSTGNGGIVTTVTGASGTPSYQWSGVNSFNGSTATVSVIAQGAYGVTVTDVNGCTASQSFTVGGVVSVNELSANGNITTYPNPSTGDFSVRFDNVDNGLYVISLKNILGQVIVNESVNVSGSYIKTFNLNVNAGIYFLTINNNMSETTQRIVIK